MGGGWGGNKSHGFFYIEFLFCILIAYRVTTVQYMKTFKEMICLDRNHNICMH